MSRTNRNKPVKKEFAEPINAVKKEPSIGTRKPLETNLRGVLSSAKNYSWLVSKFMTMAPNPDEVLKKMGAGVEEYRTLEYDPHVASCIQSRKAGVLSMEWEIQTEDNESETFKFIQEIFKKLNVKEIITEILEAPLYGYKILEVSWQELNGQVVPIEIVGKPQEWFFFDSNNQPRFRQMGVIEGVPLAPRKFFVVQHEPNYNNPYGKPILSKCYWSVFLKKDTVKFWSTFTEKYGMPFLDIEIPYGGDKAAALADGEAMRQDGVCVHEGSDSKTTLLDGSKSSSPALYGSFIDFHNAEISKAILSQTLTTEQTGGGGTQAMAQTHLQVRRDVVDSDKELVQYWFNKLIEWVVEFNIGEVLDLPRFIMYEKEDVDKSLAEVVELIQRSKVQKFTKVFFKKRFGFEDDEIEVIETAPPTTTPAFSESEFSATTKSMDALQAGVDKSVADAKLNSGNQDKIIIDFLNSSNNYTEALKGLSKLLPEMNTEILQSKIEKDLFWSQAVGKLTAQKEDKQNGAI